MNAVIIRIGEVNRNGFLYGILEEPNGVTHYFDERSLGRYVSLDQLKIDDIVDFDTITDKDTNKKRIYNIRYTNTSTTEFKQQTVKKIKDIKNTIVQLISNECEYTDMLSFVDVNTILMKNNIDFKDYQCSKLTNFLEQFPECFKIINQTMKNGESQNFIQMIDQDSHNLMQWAHIPSYFEKLEILANKALPENWYYNSDKPIILDQYIRHTFMRLYDQENGIIENDQYAAFNTGLVDHNYKDIYAFFTIKSNGSQKWTFADFCTEGEQFYGKKMIETFPVLPERAYYTKNISELLYDVTLPITIDETHIIIDNINRFPIEFCKKHIPEHLLTETVDAMPFDQIQTIIAENPIVRMSMINHFNMALQMTIKKTQLNFKTIHPMYYVKNKKITLLIPISLTTNNADVVLVVEKCEAGRYFGRTILTLEMAYSNARLIAKPQTEWLC